MKITHMTVFVVAVAGIAYLAYRNQAGMSGMFYKDSMGSALGGPVYSSAKANIGLGNFGGNQPSYGASMQSLRQGIARAVRGA